MTAISETLCGACRQSTKPVSSIQLDQLKWSLNSTAANMTGTLKKQVMCHSCFLAHMLCLSDLAQTVSRNGMGISLVLTAESPDVHIIRRQLCANLISCLSLSATSLTCLPPRLTLKCSSGQSFIKPLTETPLAAENVSSTSSGILTAPSPSLEQLQAATLHIPFTQIIGAWKLSKDIKGHLSAII